MMLFADVFVMVVLPFMTWYFSMILLFDPDMIKFLDDLDEGVICE